VSLDRMIGELNSFLTRWVTYFRHAACRSHLHDLDSRIRRKRRSVRLKQQKRAKSIADFLQRLGVPRDRSWTTAACGKCWWRMAARRAVNPKRLSTSLSSNPPPSLVTRPPSESAAICRRPRLESSSGCALHSVTKGLRSLWNTTVVNTRILQEKEAPSTRGQLRLMKYSG